MDYNFTVSDEIRDEFNINLNWYKQNSLIAAQNFIIEFENFVEKIHQNPTIFRRTFKNYRHAKMKKYPYYIIFRIDEINKEVIILRIYHTARNPENKYKGLK